MARRGAVIVMLLALLLGGAAPRAARAEEPASVDLEDIQRDRKAKQTKYPLGRRVSRYLGRAGEALEEGDSPKAERLLGKLDPKRLNPVQRAYVYRLLAVIAYGSEQPDKAIENFQKVLEQEALPLRDENRIRFTIAQLHAQTEDWKGVIRWLNEWLLYDTNPDPLGFYLMGLAYYQLQDYDTAIEKVKTALERSTEPRESWMRMLYALYTEKEDYESATPLLEELVLRFPKKAYWVQLSLIYGARENYPRSLAVQQVAYEQGYLTEDKELRRLARTYLFNELPYPAAKVLDKGLAGGQIESDAEAWELLANSWIAAREFDRSLPPLEKAAELSPDGNLYVRLGQVHIQREQWDLAAKSLEKALQKGDLKRPGNVQLLLGIAHYNGERPGRARRYFVKAREFEATRAEANRWITHLSNEAQQRAG